jgi:hypothetical protein
MVLPLLLLTACKPAVTPEDDSKQRDTPPVGTDCGTWNTVGEPFTLTWCAGCHSAELPAERRYSAPVGTDLDTLDAVVRQSAAIRSSLEAGRMPPAGGVPAAEQAEFLAWLACGAPGEAHRLTPGSESVAALGGDFMFGGYGQPEVGRYFSSFSGGTFGDLAIHFEPVGTDGGVGLESWRLTDGGDGSLGGAAFDPPLPLWPPLDTVQISERTVLWEDALVTEESEWEITFTPDPDPDPRFADTEVLLTRLDDGAGTVIEFWTSSLYGLQAMDLGYGPLSGGRKDRMLVLSASEPIDRGDDYPQQPGDTFLIRRSVLLEPL